MRVVIDDANHVTEPWGSVNSRVFDALSSGALVITNSRRGSEDVFAGLLIIFQFDIETRPLFSFLFIS